MAQLLPSMIGQALGMRNRPSASERLERQRCLLCGMPQELFEPCSTDEIGPFCSSCGAPTGLALKSPHSVTALRRKGATPSRSLALKSVPNAT